MHMEHFDADFMPVADEVFVLKSIKKIEREKRKLLIQSKSNLLFNSTIEGINICSNNLVLLVSILQNYLWFEAHHLELCHLDLLAQLLEVVQSIGLRHRDLLIAQQRSSPLQTCCVHGNACQNIL